MTSLLLQHDLLTVFAVVLLATLGIPIPALPVLLLAGAQAAGDGRFGFEALGLATLASTLSAATWYVAGRRLGRRVMAFLCRISISPDTCVRKNEISFAKRGALTLVIAKFVPGLSILAPPLAGALDMGVPRFLLFSTMGSALWAGAGIAGGLIFHEQIGLILGAFSTLGGATILVIAALLVLYVAWRLWMRWRVARTLARFERIESAELAALIKRDPRPVIVDVRSLALRDGADARIPGALRIDLAGLPDVSLDDWPASAEIITYCDCPNGVSAVNAAQILGRRGRHVRVLVGGIAAWTEAGHPVDIH